MEPVKNQLNNRILAQKGAFLNYEMLLSKNKNGITLLKELTNEYNTSSKIPRVILKIKYQTQKDSEEYNKLEQLFETYTHSNNSSNNLFEYLLRNKSHQKETNKTIINNQKIIYSDILSDLRRKLFEFKYIEEDLFPDFEDFLKNKMKLYKESKKC